MNKVTTSTAVPTSALKLDALSNIFASFESHGRRSCRWFSPVVRLPLATSRMAGTTDRSRIVIHHLAKSLHARSRPERGKVDIERPRLRGFDGKEHPVPSWEAAVSVGASRGRRVEPPASRMKLDRDRERGKVLDLPLMKRQEKGSV
jgi:hypothetical protein